MVLRIGGLASGLDTDQLIRDLMNANRIPVNKLKQDRQLLVWKRDAYKEINSKLLDFRNNKLFEFKKEATLNAKTAIVSGNTTAVSAEAKAGATDGTISIVVTNLAAAASNHSSISIKLTEAFDPNKPLSDEVAAGNIRSFGGETSFSINGTTVAIEAGDTLNSVIDKINKNTNVTAFYDSVTGKVSLTSKETGLVNGGTGGSTISVSGMLITGTLQISNGSAEEVAAVNANLTINGVATTRTSNTFDVNGVSITLNSASGGTATNIEVKTNTDAILKSILSFVESYNSLNEALYSKLNEYRFRDYDPLTEEQRSELSDKEVEQWDEKAQSGLLRRDSILQRAFNTLRSDASGVVDNGSVYNTLSAIGIETGNYQQNGKLILASEQKLRKAIETDPDAVMALFTANGNGDTNHSDVGIAERMYANLENTLKDMSGRAGTSTYSDLPGYSPNSTISKQLSGIDKRIGLMNERLADMETRYYRQFAALETAIQRLNMQSANLAGAFGV
jgi:flagellar hook-associated protein 2